MKKQTKLADRWITFIKIILDPWIIVLSIFMTLLITTSSHAENTTLKPILIFLVAILSGLIGGIFMRKWTDLHDEILVIDRGKLAIKSLKLIYFNLVRTERRTKVYLRRLNENKSDFELIKSNIEEIVEKCKMLEEECITAIGDWSDLIGDANAKTVIANIYYLEEKKDAIKKEIKELEKEIVNNPELQGKEGEIVKNKLEQKEFEINELNAKLIRKEEELNNSILSGMTSTDFFPENVYAINDLKKQEN